MQTNAVEFDGLAFLSRSAGMFAKCRVLFINTPPTLTNRNKKSYLLAFVGVLIIFTVVMAFYKASRLQTEIYINSSCQRKSWVFPFSANKRCIPIVNLHSIDSKNNKFKHTHTHVLLLIWNEEFCVCFFLFICALTPVFFLNKKHFIIHELSFIWIYSVISMSICMETSMCINLNI